MKKFIKVISVFTVLALLVGGAVGCSKRQAAQNAGTGLSGQITVAGSTSVQPLAQELASSFTDKNPGLKINVNGGGSSAGIKASSEGAAQIGTSSRELKPEEKSLGLKETVIAKDGIAIILHPSNNITNLTKEQIKKIFSGEIKNWKEVGGADKPITVVTREEGSGTRGAFEEIVMGKETKISDKAIVQGSTGGVKTTVSTTENAIGFMSIGALDTSVKAIKVDNIEANEKNVKEGAYPISRPFIFLTKGEPDKTTKAFIDYVLSDEGQKIVGEDFVTVK